MRIAFVVLSLFFAGKALTQKAMCVDPAFEVEVDQYLSGTVPFITVADAKDKAEGFTFLDAREWAEYEVSHIPGAMHVGFDAFNLDKLNSLDKNEPIIIYCSIGYRSEKIGERLEQAGFKQVYNLYGSIFEWVNQHHTVENMEGKPVKEIHTYNKSWSKWMTNPDYKKVY